MTMIIRVMWVIQKISNVTSHRWCKVGTRREKRYYEALTPWGISSNKQQAVSHALNVEEGKQLSACS